MNTLFTKEAERLGYDLPEKIGGLPSWCVLMRRRTKPLACGIVSKSLEDFCVQRWWQFSKDKVVREQRLKRLGEENSKPLMELHGDSQSETVMKNEDCNGHKLCVI